MMTGYWWQICLLEELILPAVTEYAHIILTGLRKVNMYKPERPLPAKE
jgi:hypothetical protein